MEEQMDGRMDVRKFPSVFYRTLVLWDRCPKRGEQKEIEKEYKKERKEEKRNTELLKDGRLTYRHGSG